VPEDLQQRRAHDDADNGSFTAAQAAAADDGSGNRIELVEVAMRGWGNRVRVESDDDRREGGENPGEYVGPRDDRSRVDARVASSLGVVADGEKMPSEYRSMEQHPGQACHHAQQHERHRYSSDGSRRQRSDPFEALAGSEAF